MPHLTRRFTLLRAPDGTLLSPDAMRAHLRAQRARARATSAAHGPNGHSHHHFLTEEEENEIIEQLRIQAKAEGRNFEADDYRSPELWSSGYASGTDGFGSWGGSNPGGSTNLQSLAESLGDLTTSVSSRSVDSNSSTKSPSRSGGGLFSGRSSERDMAYLRTVDKGRKEQRLEAVSEAADIEADMESEGISGETADPEATGGIAAGEPVPEAEEESSSEDAMPGDFMAVERRRSSQQRSDDLEPPSQAAGPEDSSQTGFLAVPPLSRSNSGSASSARLDVRQSRLLNTLSPEAFKRVSTALEEVFDIMAREGSIHSAGSTPVRSNFDLDRPSSEQSQTARHLSSPVGHPRQHAEVMAAPPEGEAPDRRRPSVDSDGVSFTSAVSEHGKHASPAVNSTEIGQGAAADADNDDEKPSLAALQDVHIENGGLGIAEIDFGAQPALVPASDSNMTVTNDANDRDARHSTLTAVGTDSRIEDRTPVVSLATTPEPPVDVTRVNGTADAADSVSLPMSAPREDSAQMLGREQAFAAQPFGGFQQLAGGATSASTRTDDAPVHESSKPQLASEAAAQPGSALPASASLGEAWSPRFGSHSRKPSLASSGGHSRADSSGRLDIERGSVRGLNEQSSLSSVRRHYRQHSRSATGSSAEHFGLSPRNSGAMSPVPVLSRTARSPSYFPPPSAGASMQSYAAGFKPASAVSPAAIAAASASSPRARTFASNGAASPFGSWANRTRDSGSTRDSDASPYLANAPGFSPGFGTSTETGATSLAYHTGRLPGSAGSAGHSRSGSQSIEAASSSAHASALHRAGTVSSNAGSVAPASAVPTAADRLEKSSGIGNVAPVAAHQAERWRSTYGKQAQGQPTSLVPPGHRAEVALSGLGPGGDTAEEEDLWAQMDQTLLTDTDQQTRPLSTFPASAAENHLASAGVTMNQLASYQEQLVKSAHGGQSPPPLPTTPANQTMPTFTTSAAPATPLSSAASPSRTAGTYGGLIDSAHLERARERARATADSRVNGFGASPGGGSTVSRFSGQGFDSPAVEGLSSEGGHHRTWERVRIPSFASPASSSAHGSSRVMYDVTTSHRPTSPPPAAGRPTSTGLPTLMDLSASRQSLSFVQAVEQAGASGSPWRERESVHQGSEGLDHQSIASGAPLADSAGADPTPINNDLARNGSNGSQEGIDYAHAIAFDPAASSTQDLGNHPYGHFSGGLNVPSSEGLGVPRSSSHNVMGGTSPLLQSPASHQSAWSDPGEQNGYGQAPQLNRNQLVDDVAAQARAATKALKGIDDGSAPTPPFRTKSIARKKSFRKVSKQISSPQLISTTQKMDHLLSLGGGGGLDGRTPRKNTTPAVPEASSLLGKGRRPSGAGHRRRSSSFGHSAQEHGSDWLHQQPPASQPPGEGYQGAAPDVALIGAPPAISPYGSARHDTAASRSGQLSSSKVNGNNGGSISRFMSKIRSRKTSDVHATIEPFPPSPDHGSSFGHSKSSPSLVPLSPPPQQANTTIGSWRSSDARSEMGQSPSIRSKQSFLSPTSSTHPLPRIDSTSMPNRSGKKYRRPIVLKRESEVFLPGDSEPVRPPRPAETSEATLFAADVVGKHDGSELPIADALPEEASGKPGDVPASISASSMPIQDRWEADAEAAAVFANSKPEDFQEVTEPQAAPEPAAIPASSTGASLADLQPAPTLDVASAAVPLRASSSSPGGRKSSPRPPADHARKADQRKSLRDTVVRRTIIIPTDFNFEDRRKSTMSTASRRKSRKPAPSMPDEMPWTTGMTPSSSSQGGAASQFDDSVVSKDSATSFGTAVPPQAFARNSTPPVKAPTADDMSDRALPTLPSSTSAGLSTLNSQQSLMPSSTSRGSGHLSQINTSYASSLYDMYLGRDDASDSNAVSEEGRSRSSRLFLGGAGDRTSRMPQGRHIEVTERADGSVVWQVLAGLADRGSVYSDYESRHSRTSSNGYAARDRDSLMLPNFDNRDSIISDTYSDLDTSKTPAGLTNEDSRSFFAKPRGHRKSFSFDASEAPPMPGLASGPAAGPSPPTSATTDSLVGPRTGSQAVFEMATSPTQQDDDDSPISPTRIVYHNDAQLASLLDLLARGKDSAKFEFQSMGGGGAGGGIGGGGGGGVGPASRPVSTWTKGSGNDTLDADDIESHRSRVEAEIYTLLNQQSYPSQHR